MCVQQRELDSVPTLLFSHTFLAFVVRLGVRDCRCSYAYGYGITPFLVHNSQKGGANLTWTVLWLTLCAMRRRFGVYPEELHLQLDNTTGENKNEATVCMAAYLVQSRRIKRVRVFFLPVGHTHIVIDQMFGAITTGTRGVELFLPEELAANINQTCARNPHWQAQPVQFLRSLFDIKAWICLMQPCKIKRLVDGNVTAEDGTYDGMCDFLFSANAEGVALVQYREKHTHSYRPDRSQGAKVIGALPSTPPALAEVKARGAWAVQGSNNVRDTFAYAIPFSSRYTTAQDRQAAMKTFNLWFDEVPTLISLLKPEYKLEFHDLEPDVLRIAFDGSLAEDGGSATEEDAEWRRKHFPYRTLPLAIDPVVSSAQTEAEFQAAKAAFERTLRGGNEPSSSKASSIVDGCFMLVFLSDASCGVDLVKCCGLARGQGPYSVEMPYTVRVYNHTPQEGVDGLFGVFEPKWQLADGARREARTKVSRGDVVVFNAGYENKRLTVRTLRVLAAALPEAYPIPQQLPESHLEPEDSSAASIRGTSASRRRVRPQFQPIFPRRGRNRGGSAQTESEEEEEEDEVEEDDEEEDDDSDESTDDENENPDSHQQSTNAGSVQDERVRITSAEEAEEFVRDPTGGWMPSPGDLVFVNLSGDPSAPKHAYPAELALVKSVGSDKGPDTSVAIYWFQKTSKGGFNTGKPVVFSKFWTDPNWLTKYLKKLPKKDRAAYKPSEHQVRSSLNPEMRVRCVSGHDLCRTSTVPYRLQVWENVLLDTVEKGACIPVSVPESVYDRAKVDRVDGAVSIEASWMQGTLIPICKKVGCCRVAS